MRCSCGNEIEPGDLFCAYCGAKALEPPERTTAGFPEARKPQNKKRVGLMPIMLIVFIVIIIATFCFFYIKLHGWGGVPFYEYISWLPFVGSPA